MTTRADLNFRMAVAKAAHNRVQTLIVDTIRSLLLGAILISLRAHFPPENTLDHPMQVTRGHR